MLWLRNVRISLLGRSEKVIVNPRLDDPHNQLRVDFSVQKDIGSKSNTISISIYNLSRQRRSLVGRELEAIEIEAGYGDQVGVIARGSIRDVTHKFDAPDVITEIECGDGDAALRSATISKTIPSGSTVDDAVTILRESLEEQGISAGEIVIPNSGRIFRRPYSMTGMVEDELDVLGRSNDFYWSISDEALTILPGSGVLSGVHLVSEETNLVGSPSITDNGVSVDMLLSPGLRVGSQIDVRSKSLIESGVEGIFRISKLKHAGSNDAGKKFLSTVTGERISVDGTVDEGGV